MSTVESNAQLLKDLATHFGMRDWNYTRDLGDLVAIKLKRTEWERLPKKIKRAFGVFLRRQGLFGSMSFRMRLEYAWYCLFDNDKHLPDGVLNDGSVITFWEEDGEYINVVQPSVGEMVADWMLSDPSNPFAIQISDEIERIANKLYNKEDEK